MNKLKKIWHKFALPMLFASSVFFSMFLGALLVCVIFFILSSLGLVSPLDEARIPLFVFVFVSILSGTAVAALFSRLPLRPLRQLMDAADKIASGDYSVRINPKGPEEMQNLSRKFNHMAEELGSVEMLRTDFVNNFSHEFKTPIVSIRGFAKMLKWDDITPEERNEYLDIIINESERLTDLARNVLNLSRIEQQSILTDQSTFNVSEQIRLVIAMMESKWGKKDINILFDCNEIYVYGNEELLKQVWINLLDNAIKFAPDNSDVQIQIQQADDAVSVSFSNSGNTLSKEAASHIFDKFYQGDTSHTTSGNGLGLALVKKIIDLHGGTVSVKFLTDGWISFLITLPDFQR